MGNEKYECFDEDKMPDDAPIRYEAEELQDAVDLNTKTDPKLVWVTYDPLLERIICVHDVPDCICKTCKPIWEERQRERSVYQLEERKFVIMEYEDDDLEEV